MSFFRSGGDYSDSEEDEKPQQVEQTTAVSKANKYRNDDSGSDDEVDDVRRPRSKAEKSDMAPLVEKIRNSIKINDFVSLQDGFESFNKRLNKLYLTQSLVNPPQAYLEALTLLEDHLKETSADKASLKGPNLKAFNCLKLKVKKECKTLEESIKNYRENPHNEEQLEGSKDSDTSSVYSTDESDHGEEEDPKDATLEDTFKILVASRGKKSTDKSDLVEKLAILASKSKTPLQKLEILLQVVVAELDALRLHSSSPAATWKKCALDLLVVMDLLELHRDYILVNNEEDADEEARADLEGPVHIYGNLSAYVVRLDDELFKSWQTADAYSKEYVELMKNEFLLLVIAEHAQNYVTRIGNMKAAATIARRRLEHLYGKPEEVYQALMKVQADDTSSDLAAGFVTIPQRVSRLPSFAPSSMAMIDELTKVVKMHGDEVDKFRATACEAYSLAMAGRFQDAKNLFLMHRLQDSVDLYDASTIVLYNRAKARIGLSAFTSGFFDEAHDCLCELCANGTGKMKSLLAQGFARFQDQSTEKQLLPLHMHINLELLEAAHMISAMLLDITTIASSEAPIVRKGKSYIFCKAFKRNFEASHEHVFGPPEALRDCIMAATRSFKYGDWEKASKYVEHLKVWKLIKGQEQLLSSIKRRIQQEALRCFLLTSLESYWSLDIKQLASSFQLPEGEARRIVSSSMENDGLEAKWDASSMFILPQGERPSKLHQLASKYAEKLIEFQRDADDRHYDHDSRMRVRYQDNTSHRFYGINSNEGYKGSMVEL